METTTATVDAVCLVQSLDAEQIAKRLEELTAEEKALRVLLRSARARECARSRHKERKGAGDASN